MREDLSKCEIKIDNLLKVMMISDPALIEDTYNGLIEDEVSIKKIIREHKEDIRRTESEIERLRQEYQTRSLVGEGGMPGIVVKGSNPSDNETEMSEDYNEVPREVGGEGQMIQKGLDADRIEQLEKEISHYSNILLLTESSYKKLSDILQDSCSTVSRIMFQLEPKDVRI